MSDALSDWPTHHDEVIVTTAVIPIDDDERVRQLARTEGTAMSNETSETTTSETTDDAATAVAAAGNGAPIAGNGAPTTEAPSVAAIYEAAAAEQPPVAEASKARVPPATENLAVELLRVRVKVWTDPATGKRYLMPTAIMHDPKSGLLTAYAMTDADTKVVKLTPVEWNALPFHYFKEDGDAPRASARPVDVLR
jgi:hypothetical protein